MGQTMNNLLINDLIQTHMRAMTGFQAARYALDNINFKTPLDGVWYRLTVQHGINLMVGMANEPCTRELGAVAIQIFYPNNKNTNMAMSMADAMGSHFQYKRIGKLEFMTASVINVPERENGYQINVRIPFRYN